MLRKNRPDTINCTIEVKGQGEEFKFNVVFHNRRQSEVEAMLKSDDAQDATPEELVNNATTEAVARTVLFVVKDWEAEYELSTAGLAELEDDRPGMIVAIAEAFHMARAMARTKNYVRR